MVEIAQMSIEEKWNKYLYMVCQMVWYQLKIGCGKLKTYSHWSSHKNNKTKVYDFQAKRLNKAKFKIIQKDR
jgi:hypothetical protein